MKLEIIKFDHFGRGIAKDNDKIVFVQNALPREIVDVIITNLKKNYSEAKINKIIKESKDRIPSICPFYEKCGGCQFLHTNYEVEKQFKINKACEVLGRCDHFYATEKLNYRNKCTLHYIGNDVGYYQKGTNKVIKINHCYLVHDLINMVIKDISSISFKQSGEIIIKANNQKLLLNINGNITEDNLQKLNYVDTIIYNNKLIKGDGYLIEKINGKDFIITSKAFFQVNLEGLQHILEIINRFIQKVQIQKVLDLYSGTGLWGILISDKVDNVIAVEVNKEACQNALENIKRNNIHNIKVINGKVEDYIDNFSNIDLVIVDPPRCGLDNKTREYLKRISSKYIIYISCDIQTLKRDLQNLMEKYDLLEVNLVDMFKRTYHVESVCLLSRK